MPPAARLSQGLQKEAPAAMMETVGAPLKQKGVSPY